MSCLKSTKLLRNLYFKSKNCISLKGLSVVNRYSTSNLPPLTAETYNIQRGSYATLNNEDIRTFQNIVGESNVVTDSNDIELHNVDWMKSVRGQSKLLLLPKNTDEVSQILKYSNNRLLAICPQGGNTGLVGGSVPVHDEIILSTQRMNKINSIDPISGVLVCEAGCILETVSEKLSVHNLIPPLDLGAKGSCNLGGNVSTNAGGLRFLRYGTLRGTVLGIEAVLANGTILDCLSTLPKDNTGYDLKQLMIGSEGTLGIVTKVSIACPQKPQSINLAFLGVNSFEDLLLILKQSRLGLSEILSAVEFMDSECMRLVTEHLGLTNPIGDHPFYMLIETSGSNCDHDEEKLNDFLDKIMESGLARDGTIATDFSKMKAIWALREQIAEALMREGFTFKYDMSLPRDKMYKMVVETKKHLHNSCKTVVGYGHLGDGNLHLNIVAEKFDKSILSKIEPFVYEWTANHNGSVSAEHGLGFKKRNFIGYSKSDTAINLMKQIKDLFDPNHILNPYKTLPDL